jgi:hypothetical protein
MEATEFDRLEQSVQHALDRIGRLEAANRQLEKEKEKLEFQLRARALAPRIDGPAHPSLERLAEVKARLVKVIETLREAERPD